MTDRDRGAELLALEVVRQALDGAKRHSIPIQDCLAIIEAAITRESPGLAGLSPGTKFSSGTNDDQPGAGLRAWREYETFTDTGREPPARVVEANAKRREIIESALVRESQGAVREAALVADVIDDDRVKAILRRFYDGDARWEAADVRDLIDALKATAHWWHAAETERDAALTKLAKAEERGASLQSAWTKALTATTLNEGESLVEPGEDAMVHAVLGIVRERDQAEKIAAAWKEYAEALYVFGRKHQQANAARARLVAREVEK